MAGVKEYVVLKDEQQGTYVCYPPDWCEDPDDWYHTSSFCADCLILPEHEAAAVKAFEKYGGKLKAIQAVVSFSEDL